MIRCFFCREQIEQSEARRAEFTDVPFPPFVCSDGEACDARIAAEFKVKVA